MNTSVRHRAALLVASVVLAAGASLLSAPPLASAAPAPGSTGVPLPDVGSSTEARTLPGPAPSGDVGDAPLFDPGARDLTPDPDAPTVVVAVGDTGVNPYHEAYHRPHLTRHPCEWVAGYDDCSVPALELSIGVYDTFAEAYAADLATWRSLEVGQWYWIPRTNIIGAVCDGSTNVAGQPRPVTPDTPCILDELGHGTGTTSAVLSEAPDALLLVHEGNSLASAMVTAPVAPDIQSHSWGPAAPLPLHAADPLGLGFARRGSVHDGTIFFIAAGNEAPFPAIVDSSRVHPDVQVVGGGFPGKATARSWSTVDHASWFCRPTAMHDHVTAIRRSYCGTSFSAPTAAGTAAAALLELRRAEGHLGRSTGDMVTGRVSRAAFLDALRAGATYDAQPRFTDQEGTTSGAFPMPAGTEPVWWGYGWLDATRVGAVVACATGALCPSAPELAETWNGARQEARRRQTEPLLGPVIDAHVPQDDAGSGADAGDTPATAVEVQRGVPHSASLFPQGRGLLPTEDVDWFRFTGTAGEVVTVSQAAEDFPLWPPMPPNCIRVRDADGNAITSTGCGGSVTLTLPADGVYHAEFGYPIVVPHTYTFTIS